MTFRKFRLIASASLFVVILPMYAAQCFAQSTTVVAPNGGTGNTIPMFTGTYSLGNSAITQSSSNVGIGTTNPQFNLDVVGQTDTVAVTVEAYGTGGASFIGRRAEGTPTTPTAVNTGDQLLGVSGRGYGTTGFTTSGRVALKFYAAEPWTDSAQGAYMTFMTTQKLTNNSATERMRLTDAGYLGIWTSTPSAQLEVNGNIKVTAGSGGSLTFSDASVQTTAWTGVLCGGDYAESVDVSGDHATYQPGDIIVIDSSNPENFTKSSQPYSTAIAGIYSTKPGAIGRRSTDPEKVKDEIPMAMVGIVPTKVSAENGAIHPGDLLVTSSTAGYAMKGTDRGQMLGAIVGKALGSLKSGTGVIDVLVTLQ